MTEHSLIVAHKEENYLLSRVAVKLDSTTVVPNLFLCLVNPFLTSHISADPRDIFFFCLELGMLNSVVNTEQPDLCTRYSKEPN